MMYMISIIVASLYLPLIAAIADIDNVEDAPFCEKAMELSCGLPTEHCLFWDAYICQFTNLKNLCPKWCNASMQGRKMFIDPLADELTIETDKERSICFFVMPQDCFNKYPTDICLKMHSHACSIPKVGEICNKTCNQDTIYQNNATDNNSRNTYNGYIKAAVDAPFCDKAISLHCGKSLPMELCQFWDAYACEYHNLNLTCPTKCLKTETEFKILLSSDPFQYKEHENSIEERQVCDVLFSSDCQRTNSTKGCKEKVLHLCRIPAVAKACFKRCANGNLSKKADAQSSTPQRSNPQPSSTQVSSPRPSIPAPSEKLLGNTTDNIYKEGDAQPSTPKPSNPRTSTIQLSSRQPSTAASSANPTGNNSDNLYKETDPQPLTPELSTPQPSTNQRSSRRPSTTTPSAKLLRNTSDNLSKEAIDQPSIPQHSNRQTSASKVSSLRHFTPAPSAKLLGNTTDILNNEADELPSTPQSSKPQPSTNLLFRRGPFTSVPSAKLLNNTSGNVSEEADAQPSTPQPSTPQTSNNQVSRRRPSTPATSEKLLGNTTDSQGIPVPLWHLISEKLYPVIANDKIKGEESHEENTIYDTLFDDSLFANNVEELEGPDVKAVREEACCEKVLSSACGLSEELCEIWKAYACSYRGFDKECPTLCNKVVASKANEKQIIPRMTSAESKLLKKKKIND